MSASHLIRLYSGVSFRYPSPQDNDSAHYALKNVSFTLKPSSLTVIVGQNGSGKSSLARLLTGLCQPNTGEILVDGVKTSFYKRSDLSQATASLTQDHRLFPLTIAENIGLGDHGSRHNMGLIREAASLGGAANFIDKLADRYEHSLASLKTCFRMGELPEGPLADFANGFQMSAMVSGGEKQRLVAARTFMRLLSPRTKLVVADEPSAAIDPIGEYELFEKLREHRTGKTMVFISHRFGYLTKLADQILCMKDGELVEVGTHIELMALGGEYRKLYDVQAKAFVNSDEDLLASGSAS
ncbi:P-loop containing nucleoside triphosphate hydrolase protein [Trametopsis cervina]|nr:P-loop containing nucleoside triphosphate hydrolase protein [Trametopsis cervina]